MKCTFQVLLLLSWILIISDCQCPQLGVTIEINDLCFLKQPVHEIKWFSISLKKKYKTAFLIY